LLNLSICQVLGLTEFVDIAFAAEADKAKQKFLCKSAKRRVDCLFADVAALLETTAPCLFHPGNCCQVHAARIDIAVLGPPCTPYTRRAGKRAVDAKHHAAFNCLWGPVLAWLQGPDRPRGGVLEEVAAFEHKSHGQDFIVTGTLYIVSCTQGTLLG